MYIYIYTSIYTELEKPSLYLKPSDYLFSLKILFSSVTLLSVMDGTPTIHYVIHIESYVSSSSSEAQQVCSPLILSYNFKNSRKVSYNFNKSRKVYKYLISLLDFVFSGGKY